MKSLIKIMILGLFLAGCQHDYGVAPVKKYDIQIPDNFRKKCYNSIPRTPNTENFTNRQLIEYLQLLIRANKICKSSLDAVYSYIDNLQKGEE